MTQFIRNEYPFFAGYVILQFVVLSVAWTILGGYAGYVNFGTNAFFGVGVYTSVLLVQAYGAPLSCRSRRRRSWAPARPRRRSPDTEDARHLLLDRHHCGRHRH